MSVRASASLTALDGVGTASELAGGSAQASSGEPGAGRALPTRAEFDAALPWPGLRRGSTVSVDGSVALLFAMLAEATAKGMWAAIVGASGLGLLAAAEIGVVLHRLALVPKPGTRPAAVIAALLDGFDLVVVSTSARLPSADARRLSARARNRGAVLFSCGQWPNSDLLLECTQGSWYGLGSGHGYLTRRAVTVRSSGRGAATRARTARLWLPDTTGSLSAISGSPADAQHAMTPGPLASG